MTHWRDAWKKLKLSDKKERLQLYNKITKMMSEKKPLNSRRKSYAEGELLNLDMSQVLADLRSIDEIQQNVLHMLGILFSLKQEGLVKDSDMNEIISEVIKVIKKENPELTAKAFWCLTQMTSARFSEAMVADLINCLQVITIRNKNIVLYFEGCCLLHRLVREYKNEMAKHIVAVSKYIVSSLFHPVSKIRDMAKVSFDEFMPTMLSSQEKVAPHIAKIIKGPFVKDMMHVYDQKQEIYVLNVWSSLVNLLGKELHTGSSLLNSLMLVIEKGFKSSVEAIFLASLNAWKTLINNFALNTELLSNVKRLQLLIKPLRLNFNNEKVNSVQCDTWWLLIWNLSDKISASFSQVVIPFLSFLLSTPLTDVETTASPLPKETGSKPVLLKTACEVLIRILYQAPNQASHQLSSPKKFVNFSTVAVALQVPVQVPVLIKHFKEIIKASKIVIEGLAKDTKFGNHLDTLLKLLLEIVSLVPEDGSKESIVAVTSYLQLISDIINQKLFSSLFCLKLICNFSMLPPHTLTSHYYHLEKTSIMHANLAISLMKLLLNPYILSASRSDSRYMTAFIRLTNANISKSLSSLIYGQTCIRLIKDDALFIHCKLEDILEMWGCIAAFLVDSIQKTQEVNQGDNLDYDFSSIYEVLLYPVQYILPNKIDEVAAKTLLQIWGNLYKIFARCASLLPLVEENAVCEEICQQIKKLVKPDSLKNEQFFEILSCILQIIAECFHFEAKHTPSKNGFTDQLMFLRQKQKSAGNLTSLLELLVMLLNRFYELCATDDTVEADKVSKSKALRSAVVLEVTKQLISHMKNSALLHSSLALLSKPLSQLFKISNMNIINCLQLNSKLESAWKAITSAILVNYSGPYDSEFFEVLNPLLESTLSHTRKNIQEKTKQFWFGTFAHSQASLNCPDSLKGLLKKHKLLLLPEMEITEMSDDANVTLSSNTEDETQIFEGRCLRSLLNKQEPTIFANSMSPNAKQKNEILESPSKSLSSKKKSTKPHIDDLPDEEFVKITQVNTPGRTRSSNRSRKSFIPALYSELSQNSQNSFSNSFSNSLQDSDYIESSLPVTVIENKVSRKKEEKSPFLKKCDNLPKGSPKKNTNSSEITPRIEKSFSLVVTIPDSKEMEDTECTVMQQTVEVTPQKNPIEVVLLDSLKSDDNTNEILKSLSCNNVKDSECMSGILNGDNNEIVLNGSSEVIQVESSFLEASKDVLDVTSNGKDDSVSSPRQNFVYENKYNKSPSKASPRQNFVCENEYNRSPSKTSPRQNFVRKNKYNKSPSKTSPQQNFVCENKYNKSPSKTSPRQNFVCENKYNKSPSKTSPCVNLIYELNAVCSPKKLNEILPASEPEVNSEKSNDPLLLAVDDVCKNDNTTVNTRSPNKLDTRKSNDLVKTSKSSIHKASKKKRKKGASLAKLNCMHESEVLTNSENSDKIISDTSDHLNDAKTDSEIAAENNINMPETSEADLAVPIRTDLTVISETSTTPSKADLVVPPEVNLVALAASKLTALLKTDLIEPPESDLAAALEADLAESSVTDLAEPSVTDLAEPSVDLAEPPEIASEIDKLESNKNGAKRRKQCTPVRSPISSRLRLKKQVNLKLKKTKLFNAIKSTKPYEKKSKIVTPMKENLPKKKRIRKQCNKQSNLKTNFQTFVVKDEELSKISNSVVSEGNLNNLGAARDSIQLLDKPKVKKEKIDLLDNVHTSDKDGSNFMLTLNLSPLSRGQKILQAAQTKVTPLKSLNSDKLQLSPTILEEMGIGTLSPVKKTPTIKDVSLLSTQSSASNGIHLNGIALASPSSSILKKRALEDTSSSSAKRRRVTFAEPLVQERLIIKTERSSTGKSCFRTSHSKRSMRRRSLTEDLGPQNVNKKVLDKLREKFGSLMNENIQDKNSPTKYIQLNSAEEIYSPVPLNLQDDTDLSKQNHFLCPVLINCCDDIENIIPHLTSTLWVSGLRQMLLVRNVKTIGDFCKLNFDVLRTLPIQSPKFQIVQKVIYDYFVRKQQEALRNFESFVNNEETFSQESYENFDSFDNIYVTNPWNYEIKSIVSSSAQTEEESKASVSVQTDTTARGKLERCSELLLDVLKSEKLE